MNDAGTTGPSGGLTFIESAPKKTLEEIVLPLQFGGDTGLEYFAFGQGKGALMYHLPIKRFIYVEINQQTLANYFSNWKSGSFDSAFPNISKAARDLEELELEDIDKIVSADAAKGREEFEAFGMKFPADKITFWGIVLLLGVQVYFYVYLKQLSGKLAENDAGWDVPWIGMNMSALSRILFFASVLLVPSVAVGLLGWHGINDHLSLMSRYHWYVLTRDTVLIAAFVLTVLLGILAWRYRPKVSAVMNQPALAEAPSQESIGE
jgi:hypothetical protein